MKVLKARAGVLTNLEVLTHLELLQSEFEIVSHCRKHNISRQIWRERGHLGQPQDVPTYEDDTQIELERLERVKEREKVDSRRRMEEERRERVESRDREYGEAYEKWEEEVKKQTNGTKKRGGGGGAGKKPPAPVRRELSPTPEPVEEPILSAEEEERRRAEEYERVLRSFKDKEQYYAVRPMTDALKYVTNGTTKYLTDPHYTVTRRQTPRLIQDLMYALQPYRLTKAEMLQIINCPPRSQVELWLSMEELDSRLPEDEQHQQLLDLIDAHLLPAEKSASDHDQADDQYPTASAGAGYGGDDEEMDEEEMMARAGAGQDQFYAEDKWGREGLEEVEGRDIDE